MGDRGILQRSPERMDFKQSIWRFRQTVNSLPSFPMGKTGIRWIVGLEISDFSSVSQGMRNHQELTRIEG